MKEVDVTHIELEMFVWYMKHLLKAKKVQLSQVAALEPSVESLNSSSRTSAQRTHLFNDKNCWLHFLGANCCPRIWTRDRAPWTRHAHPTMCPFD